MASVNERSAKGRRGWEIRFRTPDGVERGIWVAIPKDAKGAALAKKRAYAMKGHIEDLMRPSVQTSVHHRPPWRGWRISPISSGIGSPLWTSLILCDTVD